MKSEPQGRLAPRSLIAKRVLVADQSASSRELLRAILEDSGAQVELICYSDHLVQRALKFLPHAVLLDVTNFGAECVAVVAALRALEELQGMVIIALAPTALYPEPHSMTQAGFSAILPKPITPSRLRSVLAQQLAASAR